jgi:chitin disaccharide deacetylase
MADRTLIVNADDLGMTHAVNAGIAAAFERGIVTSASLMVRQAAAPAGAAYAKEHPELATGLHLDLGQWDYENGEWIVAYEHCDQEDPASVEREARAQLQLFRELTGRDPTHLDSHQHVHMNEPAASVAARIAGELGVSLRDKGIRYEGSFYGQNGKGESFPEAIGVEALVALLRALPPGVTELGCHPGMEMGGESSYAEERPIEVETLCDPAVRAVIEAEGIRLASFAEFGRGG